MSSARAVGAVRRLLDAAKAGHGGTLDPLATGILPIALGEATKLVAHVMDGAKVYRFALRWGEARDTDDAEGAVVATSPVRPSADAIRAALPRFIGEIAQRPPAYSAVKLAGKRAYALARAGESVEIEPRMVRIDRLDLLAAEPDQARFELACGKGTYVRALARDLAESLGTLGHVAELRRTQCGPFGEGEAISLDKLAEFGHSAASFVLPIATALDDIPALAATEAEGLRLRNGQSLPVDGPEGARSAAPLSEGSTVRIVASGKMVALARVGLGRLHPLRIFHI